MIPIKLELEAFMPFKNKMELDFSPVEKEKIFLVWGKTGSGKTSIFDAICFALYGQASGSERDSDSFKSHLADDLTECYVEFTFKNKDKIYTIRRTPKQLKLRRNGNLTIENPTAILTLENGEIVSRLSEVDACIESILNLKYSQFKKIVMLPQGEFRRFLSDNSKEKESILRKIFDTEIFEEFTKTLRAKSLVLEKQINDISIQKKSFLKMINCGDDLELKEQIHSSENNINYEIITARILGLIDKTKEGINPLVLEEYTLNSSNYSIDIDAAKKINSQFEFLKNEKIKSNALSLRYDYINDLTQRVETLSKADKIKPVYDNLSRTQREILNLQKKSKDELLLKEKIEQEKQSVYEKYKSIDTIKQEMNLLISSIPVKERVLEKYDELDKMNKELKFKSKQYDNARNYYEEYKLKQSKQVSDDEIILISDVLNKILLIQALNEKYKSTHSIYTEKFNKYMKQQAYILAVELQDKTPCPVCGSLEHPNLATNINSSEKTIVTEDELNIAKKNHEINESELQEELINLKSLREKLVLFSKVYESTEIMSYNEIFKDLKSRIKVVRGNISALENKIKSMGLKANPKIKDYTEVDFNSSLLILENAQQEITRKIDEIRENIIKFTYNDRNSLLDEIIKDRDDIQQKQDLIEMITSKYNQVKIDLAIKEESINQINQQLEKTEVEKSNYSLEFENMLKKTGIIEREFSTLLDDLDNLSVFQEEITKYNIEITSNKQKISSLEDLLEGKSVQDIEELKAKKDEYNFKLEQIKTELDKKNNIISVNQDVIDKITKCEHMYGEIEKIYNTTKNLSDIANAKNQQRVSFETYVLSSYFEEIIQSANLRLTVMTNDKYFLKRRNTKEKNNAFSGLGLEIFDSFTGKFRHVNTLSGGESFTVSLALALGMADIITQKSGGVEINTMFIDEGFGSLDEEALDNAIECLYELKDKGRYVGIISHVSELRDKIPTKLLISQNHGESTATFT